MSALPPLALVLGGARSGKSRYAERLIQDAAESGTYIATAEAGDAEMAARIAAHRARRGPFWHTIEVPLTLAQTIAAEARPERPILVDCLTLWLSNLMMAGLPLAGEFAHLLDTLRAAKGPIVLVANEVGLGLVPETPLGREFRDAAGWLNQDIAALADHVVFLAAGLPLVLKDAAARPSPAMRERGDGWRQQAVGEGPAKDEANRPLAPTLSPGGGEGAGWPETLVAMLADRHPALAGKTPAERHVAIILDKPEETIVALIDALRMAGYHVGDDAIDAAALARRLRSPEENLSFADYAAYFASLAPALQQRVTECWGEAERDPMFRPGRLDCGRFLIPAFRTGNIAILKPSSPSLPYGSLAIAAAAPAPPHSHVAVCAWLADAFRADAVVEL